VKDNILEQISSIFGVIFAAHTFVISAVSLSREGSQKDLEKRKREKKAMPCPRFLNLFLHLQMLLFKLSKDNLRPPSSTSSESMWLPIKEGVTLLLPLLSTSDSISCLVDLGYFHFFNAREMSTTVEMTVLLSVSGAPCTTTKPLEDLITLYCSTGIAAGLASSTLALLHQIKDKRKIGKERKEG
jgi:hypothetical protein